MLAQLSRRAFRLLPVFLLVTLATTLMLELLPGDPAVEIAGEEATEEQLAAVNERYGFDEPIVSRYTSWLGDVATLDFGTTYRGAQDVRTAIAARLPVTLELALLATLLALAVGIPLGVVTAQRAGSAMDRGVGVGTSAVISIPAFLLALILLYIFAVRLEWLPVTGWVPLTEDPLHNLRSAVLPVLTLAISETVIIQRVLRVDLLHTLREDFITVARSKGLSTSHVLLRHALRPSSFSLLTLVGLSMGRLLGGTVIVESVFVLPGIGQLLVQAIRTQDYALVQGIVMFVALVYLAISFLTDVLYAAIDPRLRSHR